MERERDAAEQATAQIPRPIRLRTFVRREHDLAHQRLFADYFAEQPVRVWYTESIFRMLVYVITLLSIFTI